MSAPIVGHDPYNELYADAKLWLQRGWVDYLVPQACFPFGFLDTVSMTKWFSRFKTLVVQNVDCVLATDNINTYNSAMLQNYRLMHC